MGSLGERLSPSSLGQQALGELPTFQQLSSVLGVISFNIGREASNTGVLLSRGRMCRGNPEK